ncbi:hypothetical protein OIU77_024983 [Salix suchowensis]|uniref:Uncharacterized protein n=1 Tax=Salix suchowensis TaxID=1278906 RepID=A0ABQ9BUN6_9ROSI|nr:hypothetical protein OIU77_024983 [Salix suchowensis]
MSTLDATRAELALIVMYLNKAEARDKICRAIQYGSKFLSDGQPGTAQNVDKSTSLARKVFRLFKVDLSMICMVLLVQFLRGPPCLLFYWESPKMRCCQLSCFLIKLFGLEEVAFTRTKNVLS